MKYTAPRRPSVRLLCRVGHLVAPVISSNRSAHHCKLRPSVGPTDGVPFNMSKLSFDIIGVPGTALVEDGRGGGAGAILEGFLGEA